MRKAFSSIRILPFYLYTLPIPFNCLPLLPLVGLAFESYASYLIGNILTPSELP